ncbi:MAG: hypothetical protein I3275_04915 [Candidatus Moeniiplasma glomeromycotorum]|nr:hypothetical protein [Candidatus Moeniiplasma glomeromycotorum]
MTSRIVAKSQKNTIKIEVDTAERKKITFSKGAAYDNDEIKTEGGTGAAINANQIRTGNGGATITNIGDIQGIVFKLPKKLAEQLARYLAFKEQIREAKADYADLRIVLTNLAYDGKNTATKADTPAGKFELEGNDIVIDENSFTTPITTLDQMLDQIKLWNVNIREKLDADAYANTETPNVTDAGSLNDGYKEEKLVFEKMEKVIDGIETKLTTWKTAGLPAATDIQGEINLLEICLGGLGGHAYKHDEAGEVVLSTGKKSITSILHTKRGADKDDVKELAAKALFDLDTFNDTAGAPYPKYYREKIFGTVYATNYGHGGLYQKLSELKIWSECGFTTFEEIARANANGFCISNRGADTTLFDLPNNIPINGVKLNLLGVNPHQGKIFAKKFDGSADVDAPTNITAIKTALGTVKTYQGFNIINNGEEADTVSNDVDKKHIVFEGLQFKQGTNQKINKLTIDNFRDMMSKFGYMADGKAPGAGGSNKGLEDKDTIKDRKDCMGYEIGEKPLGGHGIEDMYSLLTKVEVDILEAPNRATAIDLAFYGKDFDATAKANKLPNPNLELNEQSSKNFFVIKAKASRDGFENSAGGANWRDTSPSRVKILNNYYEVMKIHSGQNKWSDDKYNVDAAKTEIDKAYNAAKAWAEIWDRWTSTPLPNKTQAAADKVILERYLEKNGTPTPEEKKVVTSNPKWKTAMEDVWKDVDRVSKDIPVDDKMLKEAKDELEKLRNATGNSEEVKKFYQAVIDDYKKDKDFKKEIVDKIKTIVEAVKKVLGGSASEADCNALIAYETTTDKAWEVAKAIKVDDKEWINDALTKAKTRKNELLEAAKQAAKTAMESEGGDADTGAYKKIGVADETLIDTINKITELFNKAKAAWAETAYNDGIEAKKSELNNYKDNDEWKKIDKYEKDGKKYATGALEKLEGLKQKNKFAAEDLKNKPNGNEVMEAFEKGEIDPAAGIKKEDAERFAICAEFKNSSDPAEKDLVDLLKPNNASEFKDDEKELDKELTRIKDVIKKLEEYKGADDTSEKGKVLKKTKEKITKISDVKTTLDNWIKKLKTRQQDLQTKIQERDKNKPKKTEGKTPWYKTTPAIISYFVVAAGAIGGIAWLALKGGSESEDDGEE